VTLWSRYGTIFTDRLPRIAEAVCSLAVKSALIDGEAVGGPDAALPDVLMELATCERKDFSRRCGAQYTDLARGLRIDQVPP
jgi:hypothetical protein